MNAPTFRKEIIFTDGEGFDGMDDWNYSVPLKLYNVSAGQGNVQNLGEREPYQLLLELSGGVALDWSGTGMSILGSIWSRAIPFPLPDIWQGLASNCSGKLFSSHVD